MEYLEMRKPLIEMYKAAVSDMLYLIRRCRNQPNPAKNGKGQLYSQLECVAGIATD